MTSVILLSAPSVMVPSAAGAASVVFAIVAVVVALVSFIVTEVSASVSEDVKFWYAMNATAIEKAVAPA